MLGLEGCQGTQIASGPGSALAGAAIRGNMPTSSANVSAIDSILRFTGYLLSLVSWHLSSSLQHTPPTVPRCKLSTYYALSPPGITSFPVGLSQRGRMCMPHYCQGKTSRAPAASCITSPLDTNQQHLSSSEKMLRAPSPRKRASPILRRRRVRDKVSKVKIRVKNVKIS